MFCGETIVRSWFDHIKVDLQNSGVDLSTQFSNEMLESFMQQHPKPPTLDLAALLQDGNTQRTLKGPQLRKQQMAAAKPKAVAKPAKGKDKPASKTVMKTAKKEDKKQKAPVPKAKAAPKAKGKAKSKANSAAQQQQE